MVADMPTVIRPCVITLRASGVRLLERLARFVAADRLGFRRLRSWSSLRQERVSTIGGSIDGYPMNSFPASASLTPDLDGQHLSGRFALSRPYSQAEKISIRKLARGPCLVLLPLSHHKVSRVRSLRIKMRFS